MVVSIVGSNKLVVVPINWIMDINRNWEKFTNYGLNTNQKFVCYWSSRDDACDENVVPNNKFAPNFDANMADHFPCIDGCFNVKLIKFKGKYMLIKKNIFKYRMCHFSIVNKRTKYDI